MINPNIIDLAKKHGFTYVHELRPDTMILMPEVRDMCSANSCGLYDKNWSCPPACGTLEECRRQVRAYHTGILVQTMGKLDDSFDYEAMILLEKKHKQNFYDFRTTLTDYYPNLLALGAGACTLCKKCTYPDEPCRFPEKSISSMEAYGLLVNQICTDNGMLYYYGPNTMTYTSCYLLE